MTAQSCHGSRWAASVLAVTALGCVGHLQTALAPERQSESQRGWSALRDGDPKLADASFARALDHDPRDARALFGVSNLAYERGDDETALEKSLALLELAGKGEDRLALALAGATLSRVSRLLAEVPDRRAAEERFIALDPGRLPWQARYALALIVIEIARKRGDSALLAKTVAQAGCLSSLAMVGRGGRLPYLDISDGSFTADEAPQPLVFAGCLLQLNAAENRAGIRVLRSEVDLPAGRHHIVLDFAGPARLRVDRGDWHRHGGLADGYGPRWSAATVDLAGGKHTVEVRVGSYGATADLAVVFMPARAPVEFQGEGSASGDDTMMVLASALLANLVGDTDGMLAHIDRLAGQTQFAVGLAAAARLGEADPTRPGDIMRDKARELFSRAVAVDPSLARAWLDLSGLEMRKNRPREAATAAERATSASPGWWPGHLGLAAALRAQGFDRPADDALAAGVKLVEQGRGGCALIDQALQRAEDRDNEAAAARLVEILSGCDAQSDGPRRWLERHGDLPGAKKWFDRNLVLTPDPVWLRSERAEVLLALGDLKEAQAELTALAGLAPRDTSIRLRLADVLAAAGEAKQGKVILGETLAKFSGRLEVRQAAQLAGLPLPLDPYRLDGKAVIRDFRASGRSYEAPAVVVLDRAVEKILADGSRVLLTHTITQVLSKEAVEQVGEVQVPDSAQILALRTLKADGTVREAEEISGKSSISVPNLAVGDFVEAETVELKEPRDSAAPGFLGERFYFQSFDAPLDRSEYVVIAPRSMRLEVSARANPPAAVPGQGKDGEQVLTFTARGMPQAFAERSAVPVQEWLPSVRVSSGLSVLGWSRFIADGFLRVSRGSPQVRDVAAEIASKVGADRGRLPEAIVSWVREHIEPEASYAESATGTLARGRGNRTALVVALARSLGVACDLVLARSLRASRPLSPIAPEDLDDFREVLLRFPGPAQDRYVDPQLRRAPFAYLPPALDGAMAIVAGDSRVVTTSSGASDGRNVRLRAEMDADGVGQVSVLEKVSGWPAVEWTELLDRFGKDRSKLRQEFEQRWLGQQFPGAQLDSLSVEPDEAAIQVRYTFKLPGMAARQGSVLDLRLSFFQSQPGRRFCTEPERKTTLLLGFDIPVDLDAEILLPKGAKVIDLGRSGNVEVGAAAFREERSAKSMPDGRSKLVVRRHSRLPLMRVEPASYAEAAAKLRAVDPVEQGEIRIEVPAAE